MADSLPLVTKPKRRFRVTYVVNEDLQLDFWARDSEHAYELATEAEQEGLITSRPMWEVLEVEELSEDASFNPINEVAS